MSITHPRFRRSGALFMLIGLIGSQLIGSLAMPSVLAGANTPPTIVASSSTPLLQPPVISGVISDPTDPAARLGITLTVSDAETSVAALVVTATSNNSAVVPDANLVLSGSGATRTLKITPVGVGFAFITLTVTDAGSQTGTAFVNYAASAASVAPVASRFHTGTSDASTAIAVDSNYMFVATDENEKLGLYDRKNSGLPLALFDMQGSLGLTQTDNDTGLLREVDIEAAARSGNRIFWLASHSNAANGNQRPNRRRLFATDISGTGASATLTYVGRYEGLRTDMIAWDTSNAHGKGANFYGLAASTTTGVIPESADGSGFNIEGLEFAPDGTTLYVAFRAPIAPAAARTKALIIPVTNAAALVSANPAAGPATFGAPIELDLGGRGIRELRKNAANEYVISAGPAADATGVPPADFRLYTWTGNPADAPVLRTASLTALATGGSFETIVEVPSPLLSTSQLQLLTDNGDTIWYNDGTASKALPQLNFQKFRSDIVTLGPSPDAIRIRDIQGASHTSPLVTVVTNDSISTGLGVTNVPGIVTAVTNSGFYLQDPAPDADIATSEGIFVFASAPQPAVGDSVTVSGTAIEFRSTNPANLTITAIAGASPLSWALVTLGNPLPAATIIGAGGRVPPTSVIEDDSVGNVETSNSFDPASDGIDFYESLEGMRAQVNSAVVVGPTTSNGEIAVLADNGTGAGTRTPRGGIIIGEGYSDFNPERVILDDALAPMPQANVGDSLGNVIGVFSYTFGNYKLLATQAPTLTAANLARETTALTSAANGLTIADFNVENLRPSDTARITQIAQIIVQNLGAPDLLSVQEIQDNNGATDDAVVAADQTFQAIITAITAAGGPTYAFRTVDPVDDQDGGEPGGNIRQGFLFRTDRGLAFVDRAAPAGTNTSTTAVSVASGATGPQLSWSPGRIDPANAAFTSSRKPLIGEFSYNGTTLFVINNHLNSKGGDDPLFGRFQQPQRSSETQRLQQAQVLAAFIGQLKAADANAAIVVTGDLNDFHFSPVITTLTQAGMVDLMSKLPAADRYSYVFDGNSQSLDHILVSTGLSSLTEYDVVHVNSEFADSTRVSDHDPSVARLTLAAGQTGRTIYLPLVVN